MREVTCDCGTPVEPERVELGFDTCMACGRSVQKYVGFPAHTGKTGNGGPVILDARQTGLIRLASIDHTRMRYRG